MQKVQLLKIHKVIAILLTGVLFFQCKSKEKIKDLSFQSIENYFKKKRWEFPINIIDTTLTIKYYHDTSALKNISTKFTNDIQKIKKLYQSKSYAKKILTTILFDTTFQNTFGFTIALPTIYIDTSDYGTARYSKIYLGFLISKYKINRDSLNGGLPCEDCIPEENKKILRYPNGIYFELNNAKDSLIFSRWD